MLPLAVQSSGLRKEMAKSKKVIMKDLNFPFKKSSKKLFKQPPLVPPSQRSYGLLLAS